ncbi:hypothetical protein LUZ60_003249 [Juncus effusus]|nr:hypothetical protein LUZ60_003249 [Juncus effusus]
MAEKKNSSAPHVLVIPFPSQGHLLPLLDLVRHLSTHHLSLTIAITPKNLPLLSPLLSSSPSIEILVIPFPSHPSIPHGVENSKDMSLSFFAPFMHTLVGLKDPLLSWAKSNPKPVSVILSDSFLGWTQQIADELNIPRIVFSSNGLLFTAISHLLWLKMPKRPDLNDHNFPISFPEVPNSPTYPWRQLSWLYRTYKEGDPDSEFIRENFLLNLKSAYIVSNSFSDLEGDGLKQSLKNLGKFKKVWAVGPLSPTDGAHDVRGRISSELATWLEQCPNGSVVYICFGSQSEISDEQAKAVADALELSQVRFVWVLRGSTCLPTGFETRSAERGRVIRGWAPQVAILNHSSVGWFLTHCGWNSVLEAITAGVAMLTWPLGADQFCNARLLIETAKIAKRVTEGANAVPEVIEVANDLKGIDSEEGREMSTRAGELGRLAKEAMREGGSSWRDLEEIVLEISKISEKQEINC